MPNNSLSAPVWCVGEFPTVMDQKKGTTFGGQTGVFLDDMLQQCGYDTDQIHYRYLTRERPFQGNPTKWYSNKTKHNKGDGSVLHGEKYIKGSIYESIAALNDLINEHKPGLVILLGNLSLYAVNGTPSVSDWRGSQLQREHEDGTFTKFMPTFAPDACMKMYQWRYLAMQDMKRAFSHINEPFYPFPEENFLIEPSWEEAVSYVNDLIAYADKLPALGVLHLGVDLETRFRHITCIGIAQSPTDAICIPFSCHAKPEGYWTFDQEVAMVILLRKLLTHPNVRCHGQNFTYDQQYFAREWGFMCTAGRDTMIQWHAIFPGLQKSLAFISSMVLENYVYWKDEGKGHAPDPAMEHSYWTYNCKDAARTLELTQELEDIVEDMDLIPQSEEQHALVPGVMKMMLRGVKQDKKRKGEVAMDLMKVQAEYDEWFASWTDVLTGGVSLVKSKNAKPWWRSPTQQMKIFYEFYGVKEVRSKEGRPTVDDAALSVISKREPLLKEICTKILEYRSIGVFLSTFALAKLDWDGRIRSSYGIGMAETYRFTSSKDSFGFGANLQNIPKGNE